MCTPEKVVSELDPKYLDRVVKFVSKIRNKKLQGSYNIALSTVTLLEEIVNEYCDSGKACSFEFYDVIHQTGQSIVRALPQEIVAANMVRRVLRGIRDECKADGRPDNIHSLQGLVLAAPLSRRKTIDPSEQDLRGSLRDFIADLRAELEASVVSICSTALEHVHASELILTYGASTITERFLRSCISRKYRLIVVEGLSCKESHGMAHRLSNAGVSVTLIGNASIFSVMSRVNKVVIGVRAALAGGAVLAEAGMHLVTMAAQHYSVPVIALTPLYKLSPVYACDEQYLNCLGPVSKVLPYGSLINSDVHVYGPKYDLVPADHITLFITNIGGTSPSYIYRLLSELYDPKHTNFLQ